MVANHFAVIAANYFISEASCQDIKGPSPSVPLVYPSVWLWFNPIFFLLYRGCFLK